MLRIVDYAKRKDIEWYEVIRQAINESSVTPGDTLLRLFGNLDSVFNLIPAIWQVNT